MNYNKKEMIMLTLFVSLSVNASPMFKDNADEYVEAGFKKTVRMGQSS